MSLPKRVRYRNATYLRVANNDYLYHVSYVSQLPSITRNGLTPGAGGSFGGGYAGHSSGRIFWTEHPAISFWMNRKGDMAENISDNPVQSGLIPIVLRRHENSFRMDDIYDDEAGTADAPAEAYYTENVVPSDQLEVWDGSSWVPVTDADPEGMIEDAYDSADKDYEDDEELVYLDSEHFLP